MMRIELVFELSLIHTSVNVWVCVRLCIRMLTLCPWRCCVKVNSHERQRLHLCVRLRQIATCLWGRCVKMQRVGSTPTLCVRRNVLIDTMLSSWRKRTRRRKCWHSCELTFNAENGYRTHSLLLRLHQIFYSNTMLQYEANANVDAGVNEVLGNTFLQNVHTDFSGCR